MKITLRTLITFFCLLCLICLFIPIYFWHSLTKAEFSQTLWLRLLQSFCANYFFMTLNLLIPFLWKMNTIWKTSGSCKSGYLLTMSCIIIKYWRSSANSHNFLYWKNLKLFNVHGDTYLLFLFKVSYFFSLTELKHVHSADFGDNIFWIKQQQSAAFDDPPQCDKGSSFWWGINLSAGTLMLSLLFK